LPRFDTFFLCLVVNGPFFSPLLFDFVPSFFFFTNLGTLYFGFHPISPFSALERPQAKPPPAGGFFDHPMHVSIERSVPAAGA